MSVDFLNTYIPETAELSKQDILDVRSTLQDYLTVQFPDVATQPGTVLGDLVITPQSYLLTAVNKGLDNITSDICLQNVADGNIFNCDFVKLYLNNFGIKDILSKPITGVVRLVFSENKQYVLDRGTQFKLDNTIFSIYLPNDGDFYCEPSNTVLQAGINGDNLKDTGSGSWFCDIPVISNHDSNLDISAGDDAQINIIIPELEQAYALDKFYGGSYSISLPNLAQLTQTTSYSASLNTRAGTVMYVNKFCPFVTNVFAVRSGDRELIRSYKNGYGISFGCMDVFLRSQSYQFTETQQVKVTLDESGEWLEGQWDYVGQPYHLESITHPAIPLKDIEDREIISTSDQSLALGALAAYTKHEKIQIRIKHLKDEVGNSLFGLSLAEGPKYTYVTVKYQTDPMFKYAQQCIENIDFAPVNTSIMVRGFIPVIIKQFKVIYVRKPGVIPNLEEALDAIKIYLGNLGVPNQYSKAEIAKIMHEAGVSYIKDIHVDAYIQWSIGDKIQNFEGNIENTLVTTINSDDELRVQYPSIDKDLVSTDMYACSPRILRYFVIENAITFNEVRDV